MKERIKFKRLFLGSLVGSISVFLLFLSINNFCLFIIKVIISFFMVFSSFGMKRILKNIGCFYIVSIFLGGFLYLVFDGVNYSNKGILFINNGWKINFIVMIIISPIVIWLFVKERIIYRNIYDNIFSVIIKVDKKIFNLKGMIDTGNQLIDPCTRKSILLLDNNIHINLKKYFYVPYTALNTSGVIKCIRPDEVVVNDKKFDNCLVGISNDKLNLSSVDCILPNIFKEKL